MPRRNRKFYLEEHIPTGFQHATEHGRVQKGLAGAKSVDAFLHWVRVCLRNKAVSEWRKDAARSRRLEQFKDILASNEAIPIAESPNPLLALTPELRATIVPRLTPTECKLFELLLQKAKARECAVALGWKPGTAWTRRAELKKKIVDIVREKVEGETCE